MNLIPRWKLDRIGRICRAACAPILGFVLLTLLGTPSAAVTDHSLAPALGMEELKHQASVGQTLSRSMWRNAADQNFQAFVADRVSGPVHWIGSNVAHFAVAENGQRINVAYVNLAKSRGVHVSPPGRRGVVGTFAAEIGAHVSINGNWYSPWDGPAISNGHLYGGQDHAYTALFGVTAENRVVLEHHQVVNPTAPAGVINGVSGHPTLIHGGQIQPAGNDPVFRQRHPRTVIGQGGPTGILILVTVDGRQPGAAGMTGEETAVLMQRLGAHQALMLDGGGSTTMWVSGVGIVNSPSGPPRQVGNEIAVFGGPDV